MDNPYSKSEIIEQLTRLQHTIADTIEKMSPEQFHAGTAEAWSPADYLKHLILSVKLTAKGMNMPKEQLQNLFGQPDDAPMTYAELVAAYKTRLGEGLRAEDYDSFVPANYRFPEDVEDVKAYLVNTWHESNTRLLQALEGWEEADLDHYQLPHPAFTMISMRETMLFTVYHNTLHWQDIQKAGG